jgi:hypothetical protein
MTVVTDRNELPAAWVPRLFSSRQNAVYHVANAVVVATLALSLVSGLSSMTFVLAALLLVLVTNYKVITESTRNFDRIFRISDNGIASITIILYFLVAILTIAYHGDGGRNYALRCF